VKKFIKKTIVSGISNNDGTVKISKFLADCGIASRRASEDLVKSGRVSVNGKRMANVAKRINPKKDKVEYGNRTVKPLAHVYYLLNKPLGYTSTTKDRHAKKLVTGLVPKIPPVWPVGRLDQNTEGLMILTNDGDLTQKLTHPKYEREKEYHLAPNQKLTNQEIKRIQNGVNLEDGFIKPDWFEEIENGKYKIIIHSGKKRVVRRLIERIGKSVMELKRVRIDFLTLDGLESGKWRKLSDTEVKRLLQLPYPR
jgi:23S rRNA pseudouridine2605 synthase